MKAYAQKQNQPQQQVSSDISRSSARSLAATPMVDSNLHLQRTIGNQAVQRLIHSHAEGLDAGSDTSVPTRFAHDFSRIPVHSKTPVKLQAKLTVNTPGDMYEQEADRVAEQVTGMPEPQLQRSCACGGGCPKCQNEQAAPERLLMKSVQANNTAGIEAPPIVNEVLRSSGQPLDPSTRAFMESRFGHDFSQVRVHTDEKAAESARSVGALAYTVGRHIAFARGQHAPGTPSGRHLLAHELTHAVQQSGNQRKLQQYSNARAAQDIHKSEAEQRPADAVGSSPKQGDDLASVPRESPEKGCSKAGGCNNGKWNFEYDGCSLPAFVAKAYGVNPDNPAGGADTQFGTCTPSGKACDSHDECYQSAGADKEKCDSVMKDDMLAICHASREKSHIKDRCYFWAKKYFWGLGTMFARKAFKKRQAQVKECK